MKSSYTAGLAAKKDVPYAKDSVDFVLLVRDPIDSPFLKPWGFEAKGRVTANTAAEEERNLRFLSSPHVRIDDDEVFDEVANLAERFQVLQHAFVYDFSTVVLAISDAQSDLICSKIIDFSDNLKDNFGSVLQDLKNASLEWAYPDPNSFGRREPKVLKIPERICSIAESITTINGMDTLKGTANIWYSLVRLSKPFPSLIRLIPAIYAFWNAVKGGSDTTTKVMDDCLARIPKVYLNTETVAVNRLISLAIVLIFRVNQVFTSKEDVNSYPCLENYRKAASDRMTFHACLLSCNEIMGNWIADMENGTTNENVENQNPDQGPRRNPTRLRCIDGVLPTQINFGAVLPTKTPRKISNQVKRGTAPIEVKKMVEKCSGMIMKSHPVKSMRCALCEHKTSYYCVGCKRWLCLERRNTKDNPKELELYPFNVRGKPLAFQKSCFHNAHEASWIRLSDVHNQCIVTP